MPGNKKTPNGRPLKKDCYEYFRDEANWVTVKVDASQMLRTERLKHTKILRVVLFDQRWSEWMGPMDHVLVYSLSNRSLDHVDNYARSQPSVAEAANAVYNTWREEE